ncbi:MAG: TRAP transporter small permease [Planctomycetes bacterium]|nr:TRAP transporter small permease [Planctomycetota bacterium]
MKKALGAASNIMEILTVACFLILAALVFLQIGGRWFGIRNIGWTEEMVSCFTTWMVFLGLAYLCERDGHIKITMLQDALPAWMKTIMMLVARSASILCGIAMTYSGYIWARSNATKITPSLQISYNIWYRAIWVCGIIFTVFALVKLFETMVSSTSKKTFPTTK